jgi:hypothetical protein
MSRLEEMEGIERFALQQKGNMADIRKGLSPGRLALIGSGVLVIALALAAAAGALLGGQDALGHALVSGAILMVGAVFGFGLIVAAIVRCVKRSC